MEQEWMTSSQAKERFGLTFKVLTELADNNNIERKEIYLDSTGETTFIFRVEDVRRYIESL